MPDKLLSHEYGLSNSKLEECNTSPSDVRSGKTFYSGDKNKKTGNLVDHGSITDVVSVVRATDQSLGDRAFIRIQPGIYTTNASSGYPEVSIPFYDMISQLGVDRGAWGTTINPGGSVTIPQGWHNGSGKVTANNPASNWNMRYFGGNADNFYHNQPIGAPDGNGTYAWGCSGYVYFGNENSHLSFNFYGQSYDKWGNNNNFMFYGTNYFDGNTTLGYSIWGGNLNFYYCRVR